MASSLIFTEGGQDTHRRVFTAPLLVKAQVLGVLVMLPSTEGAHHGCRSRGSGDRDKLPVT